MNASQLSDRVLGWFRRRPASEHSPVTLDRGPRTHVIILDGTMSSLDPDEETNAGLTYHLLQEAGGLSLYYEAGLQWRDWRSTADVMMGRGINRQIRRAYGFLASRYRPGDRIFLMGYSRGAYAVRSLAGVIDMVGLLRADKATERNVRQVYRLYETAPESETARVFARTRCHESAPIEMIGVWDTVKALGLRLPFLWRVTEARHSFHNDQLGPSVRHGYHALALNETRLAYAPVLWRCPEDWPGNKAEQVWFNGTHGDVGGQIDCFLEARGLSNIPLVWMLENLERHGITLPDGWRDRFPTNPEAPSVGLWRGFSKMFLIRKKRVVGQDISERLHETVTGLDELPSPGANVLDATKITVR